MPAHVPHQILARLAGSGHSAAGPQSVSRWLAPEPRARSPALPRIWPPGLPAAFSSTRRNVERTNSARGRMPLSSVRFGLARKSARTTSSMRFCVVVASSRNCDIRLALSQDAVHVALTEFRWFLGVNSTCEQQNDNCEDCFHWASHCYRFGGKVRALRCEGIGAPSRIPSKEDNNFVSNQSRTIVPFPVNRAVSVRLGCSYDFQVLRLAS
jgi:hypothetical protein